MNEIISNTFINHVSRITAWDISELLLVGVIFSFAVWYFQYRWNNWKLYKYSKNIPGPTAYPIIGCSYLFLGTTERILENLQWIMNTYPDLARIWHDQRLFYMVTNPKYLEIVMTQSLAKEALYRFMEPALGQGIFTAPVKIWKKNRKMIVPTFNQMILNQFVEVFSEQSDIFIEQMKPLTGRKDLDLFHIITRLTLDIICETAMGIKINAQTSENVFGNHVDAGAKIVYLRMFSLFYHFDIFFNLSSHKKRLDEALSYIKSFTSKVIKDKQNAFEEQLIERKSLYVAQIDEGTKRRAFLDYLLELEKLNFQELYDEVITFMIGGSDTTGSTLCFIFTILGMFKDVQQKVYEEVMDLVGPDRRIEPPDLLKLNYLERVIKEVLRLFPIAPIIVRAIDEDVDLKDGHILAAGSSAVIGILNTHRSARYWKDPLKFDPDRFLPEEIAKRHPCSYLPFSFGPRNCAGIKFAMMEMKTVVSTVIRVYKINCDYKEISEIRLIANVLLRTKDGHKVSFEERCI